ncbi:hypothetical protein C6Q05_01120 [Burkholderia multivorans]|nr:hypothetical protein C6P91_21210 [Burkholderia multivorans]PRF04275.1 hypothetical protein C6Q05_01120 [Burkholderia multivorans]
MRAALRNNQLRRIKIGIRPRHDSIDLRFIIGTAITKTILHLPNKWVIAYTQKTSFEFVVLSKAKEHNALKPIFKVIGIYVSGDISRQVSM